MLSTDTQAFDDHQKIGATAAGSQSTPPRSRVQWVRPAFRWLAVAALLLAGGWAALWAFRLTRAVFLPGNLQVELHWVEVGLLAVLGFDLLLGVLRRPRLAVVADDEFAREVRRCIEVGSKPRRGGIVVRGPQVSRHHLELHPNGPAGLRLVDLGSTNGTFFNGKRLASWSAVPVKAGDSVELGRGGPRLEILTGADRPLLPAGWRLGALLALLWIGLALGWAANVERLPAEGVVVGSTAIDYSVFTNGWLTVGTAAALTALLSVWSFVVNRGAVATAVRMAHRALQVLLVVGTVVLYALFPAESLRYARAAERAHDAVGATVWESSGGTAHDISEERGVLDEAVASRAASGRRSLGLAGSLGGRVATPWWRVTYFRQLIGTVAGLVLLVITPLIWRRLSNRADRALRRLSSPFGGAGGRLLHGLGYPDVMFGLFGVAIVVVTIGTPLGFSPGTGGNLWLRLPGGGSVQSIELVKACFVLFMVGYFTRCGKLLEIVPRARHLVPFVIAAGAVLAVTGVQADMGGLMMLGLFVAAMFVLGTGAWRLMAVVPALLGLGLGLAALLDRVDVVKHRIALWLDPRNFPTGEQMVNARQLLQSSGWFGHGANRSLAWSIPDVHGDLVFAAIAERYGLVGVAGLVGVWVALVLALLVSAASFGRSSLQAALLLGSVSVLLTIQILTQAGGAVGLMPFTGVPLPWLSHGLTATLVYTGLVGLAVAVANKEPPPDFGRALPARRVAFFAWGTMGAFAVVVGLAAWWMVVLPASGASGGRGAGYRWVDLERLGAVEKLVTSGVIVRQGNTSRVTVDHEVFRRLVAEEAIEDDLLGLIRITEGLRWTGGRIEPLPWVVTNPNRFAERALPRGWILDRQGRVLAMNDRRGERMYPVGAAVFHLVGLPNGLTSGLGLEAAAGKLLTSEQLSMPARVRAFAADIHHGADLVLTVDAGLQRAAYEALGGRRGAVVAMDLEDGALLALVSSPAPDPEQAGTQLWQRAVAEADRPLLNRAVASTAAYSPPGSTFKIVVAAAALAGGGEFDPDDTIVCRGYDAELDVRCGHGVAHGRVDLGTAVTVSCNVYFARLANILGPEAILATARAFGFNEDEQLDLAAGLEGVSLPVEPSTVQLNALTIPHQRALARVGFGQGPVTATPVQMARVGAVIATGGRLLDPYVVKAVALGRTGSSGERTLVWEDELDRPKRPRVFPRHVASQLNRELKHVFDEDRGTAAHLPGLWYGLEGWSVSRLRPNEDAERVSVAGKTGSSRRTSADRTDDAWIVAWAPADDPRVVVTVLVEDAGSGGKVAGPIAMAMLSDSLELLEVEP